MNLTTLEILTQLVAFPTVSRESNMPLSAWVRNFLADLGIDSHLIRNGDGSKSNLLTSIGPSEAGGLADRARSRPLKLVHKLIFSMPAGTSREKLPQRRARSTVPL